MSIRRSTGFQPVFVIRRPPCRLLFAWHGGQPLRTPAWKRVLPSVERRETTDHGWL